MRRRFSRGRSCTHLHQVIIAVVLLGVALFFPFLAPVSAQTPKVPVVFLFKERPTNADLDLVKANGGEITRVYQIINGLAARVPQDRVNALKNNPRVLSIDPDVEINAVDLAADTQIRADQVWTAGDIGQGIPVAILDTGIFKAHAEFSGRIAKCHSEISTNSDSCDDLNGHGTHVAGIVGATGIVIEAKGVAPRVAFYIDQVLDSNGSGALSGIIAGIDWAVSNGARIISMSLGTNPLLTFYDKTQPNCDGVYPSFTTAVNNAVSAGITVIAAAGNSGTSGLGAPACISSAIAVGAVAGTDTIASFSSQGGPMKDHGISAPGVNIYSTWLNWGYATASGTSMATPHVSGVVALVLAANPNLNPAGVRTILFGTTCTSSTSPTCSAITGTPNTVYGYGRVDALRAYNSAVSPNTPSLSLSANPSTITTGQSSTVTATASDSKTGIAVSFSANFGNLDPATCQTSSGSCSVTFTSTTTGTATITASASGYTSAQTAVTVTQPPTPSLSVSANPTTITTAQTSTISASTSDTRSNVIISFSSDIGSLNPPSCTTDTTGKCSVNFSSSLQGTATIVATAMSYTSAQTTVKVTSQTNPLLSVSVASNKGSYKRGQLVTITVTVTSSGARVSGATVSILVYYPDGTQAPSVPDQITNSNGQATFRYLVTFSAPKGVYKVVATASLAGYTSGSGSTTFRVN